MIQRDHWRLFTAQEPVAQHSLPALSGTRISLTGFQADVKKRLAALIERGGGQHSAELSKDCTHLVAESTDSPKHRRARRLGAGWLIKNLMQTLR